MHIQKIVFIFVPCLTKYFCDMENIYIISVIGCNATETYSNSWLEIQEIFFTEKEANERYEFLCKEYSATYLKETDQIKYLGWSVDIRNFSI